jgi:hypothetical protein
MRCSLRFGDTQGVATLSYFPDFALPSRAGDWRAAPGDATVAFASHHAFAKAQLLHIDETLRPVVNLETALDQ